MLQIYRWQRLGDEKKNIQIKMLFLLSIRNVERHNNHTTLKK